jgi:hypothetical protein
MSEHTEELKRLREHLTYYEAALALADRIGKVTSQKQKRDFNFDIAFLQGMLKAEEERFYGSRTAALLERLKIAEGLQKQDTASPFSALSSANIKSAERDLGRVLSDYETALDALEESRYGGKMTALRVRLERMELADMNARVDALDKGRQNELQQ